MTSPSPISSLPTLLVPWQHLHHRHLSSNADTNTDADFNISIANIPSAINISIAAISALMQTSPSSMSATLPWSSFLPTYPPIVIHQYCLVGSHETRKLRCFESWNSPGHKGLHFPSHSSPTFKFKCISIFQYMNICIHFEWIYVWMFLNFKSLGSCGWPVNKSEWIN